MTDPETITDAQIRALRDGEAGLLDAALRDLCRVALQNGTPTRKRHKRPMCQTCGWRRGGVDSWDGVRCKCSLTALPLFVCDVCHGMGTVPYDIGAQACPSCDGSGLIDPGARVLARARCAEILNAKALRENP